MNGTARIVRTFFAQALVFILLASSAASAAPTEVTLDYIYNLSSFRGALRSTWVALDPDLEKKELYVLNPSDQTVDVFNKAGLLVYSFGDEGDLGNIYDLAIDEQGTIYLLSGARLGYQVLRADFRGELKGRLELHGLTPTFVDNFSPNRILYRKGHLYLVDFTHFKVLETDPQGNFQSGLEFGPLIGVNPKKIDDYTIVGFTIDRDGNYILTVPVLTTVYIIAPDGKVTSFGRRGSSPGKFNVIAGVATDDKGHIYVADTLRCVIMVFDRDKDFTFKGEFGGRGFAAGQLIAPRDIAAIDEFLYVSQSANRGVSVYRISVK
jgi:DNA-binding beta-propeller fold protein YncE